MLRVVAVPSHVTGVLQNQWRNEQVLYVQCICGWRSPKYPLNNRETVKAAAVAHSHLELANDGQVKWEWFLDHQGYGAIYIGDSLNLASNPPPLEPV